MSSDSPAIGSVAEFDILASDRCQHGDRVGLSVAEG
jgi:hypothetical protein